MVSFSNDFSMNFVGDLFRRIRSMVEDTPYRFSWIDENVAGCGRPMSSDQVKWVKDRGITMIISLTESQLPSEWIEPLNLKYLHFPLRDHSTPDPEVIKKIVEEILKEVNNGGRVLVHCAAGLGRTGVVLASYLIVKKKIPPEEGIKIVRKMRPGSIEPHQEKSIYEFYRRISEE